MTHCSLVWSLAEDADGGAEDGLTGGSVEVHHHSLWQVWPQLPQEEHALLIVLGDGADVRLRFDGVGYGGDREAKGVHSVDGGEGGGGHRG